MSDQTHGPTVAQFCRDFLTLNGSFAGQVFDPLGWVEDVLADIFALDDDGRRRHRTYLLGVPRKNAKSTLGAAIAVYMLVCDRSDDAPQIISAAGDRKQARLVFEMAKGMIQASPELLEVCTVYRDEIRCELNGGTYKAVSAEAGLAHGLNPSTVIVDEYHVHKTEDLYVALNTGSATRNEPLTLVISTAGFDVEGSPLGKLYTYAKKVKAGEVDDPAMGSTWYGPPEGEFDHTDEKTWAACNPSWSIMNHEEMATACRQMPESEFVRYRLNGWTSTETAWLPAGAWAGRHDPDKSIEAGDTVVLGFDGAWKGDSTGLLAVRLEDLHVEVLGHWEAPTDDPHWRTPAGEVEDAIRSACARYSVREVAADPWRFEQSLLKLSEEGLPIVEFPSNSLARMIPATQAVYDSVMDGQLTHDGNPALARHVGNAVLKADARGARITKEHKASTRHIDLAVAMVIGVQRAAVWRDETPVEAQLLVL